MGRDRHPDDLEWDGGPWSDPADHWGSRYEQHGPNTPED